MAGQRDASTRRLTWANGLEHADREPRFVWPFAPSIPYAEAVETLPMPTDPLQRTDGSSVGSKA